MTGTFKSSKNQIRKKSRLTIYSSVEEQEETRRKAFLSLNHEERIRQLCQLIELTQKIGNGQNHHSGKRLKIKGVFIG